MLKGIYMSKVSNVPNHIAIIMDGNGRWATRRGLPRNLGHKEGVNAVERTIKACLKYGIKYCTFFAFSTENWKRSKEEIDGIFNLLRDYISKDDNFFIENQVNVSSIGVLEPFPDDLKNALNEVKEKTKKFDRLHIVFALNYGGRDDIVRAFNKLLEQNKKNISEKDLLMVLDTRDLPEPDFIIRTSGEMRVSNFLLYQMAYSEFYFPKVLWPDFNEKHFVKALKIYNKRNRRFGGLN